MNNIKAEIHSIFIYFTEYYTSFANSLNLIKMSHATDADFNLKITTTFYFIPQFQFSSETCDVNQYLHTLLLKCFYQSIPHTSQI